MKKVSIVMPSFNQGNFIEDSIQSVLNQTYKNIEFIVMDGGSTDNTVDILKKYDNEITSWRSHKDNGQTAAINEGFKKSTGEYIGWLNSDDKLEKDAIENLVNAFSEGVAIVSGNLKAVYLSANKEEIRFNKQVIDKDFILNGGFKLNQPGSLFSREAAFDVGLLNEDLNYIMDYEFWLKISEKYKIIEIDNLTATHLLHDDCKSMSDFSKTFVPEIQVIRKQFGGRVLSRRSWNLLRIKLGALKKEIFK